MIINKELIEKCIKYYNNFKIEKKINLYGNYKYKLLKSDEYNVYMENLSNLYILAFSMSKTQNYQEIIAQELVENLDNIVDKKNKEEKGGWNLLDDTIILKIENILNRNESK
jgi:hypothetical protein